MTWAVSVSMSYFLHHCQKKKIISGVTINKYSTKLCAVQNIDIYFNSCIKIHV